MFSGMKTPLLLISILVSTSISFAASKKAEKPEWTKLPSSDFSVVSFPAPGSDEEKQDFIILHNYQDTRTKEQCQLGNAQELLHGAALYKNYGPLSDKQFEKSRELIKNLITLGDRVAGYFKGKYERPRPYMTDDTLTPCTPEYTANRAYPSGHATAAALSACVLAEVYPKLKDELIEYGDSVGNLRVVVGAHHPSDVLAGQKLGRDICAEVLKEPSMKADIKKIKN